MTKKEFLELISFYLDEGKFVNESVNLHNACFGGLDYMGIHDKPITQSFPLGKGVCNN